VVTLNIIIRRGNFGYPKHYAMNTSSHSKIFFCLSWLLFILGLVIILLSVAFAKLPNYKTQIENWINTVTSQPISIDSIETYWTYGKPTVALRQFNLLAANDKISAITIAKVEVVLDLWKSLLQWQLLTNKITVEGSKFAVAHEPNGQIKLVGLEPSSDEPTDLSWLSKQPYISLHVEALTWLEPKQPPLNFSDLQIILDRPNSTLTGRGNLPEQAIQQFQAEAFSFTSLFKTQWQRVNIAGQFVLEKLQYAKSIPQSVTNNFKVQQQADGIWQIIINQQFTDLEQWLNHEVRLKITLPQALQAKLLFLLPQAELKVPTTSLPSISGKINRLVVAKLFQLLPLKKLVPKLNEVLSITQGDLYDVEWVYNDNWQVDANFSNLHLALPQANIRNFSGHLAINSASGQLQIDLATIIPSEFPFAVTRLKGAIALKRWQISTERLRAMVNGIPLQVAGKVEINGNVPKSDLIITVNNNKLEKLIKHIPDQKMVQQLAKLTGNLTTAQIALRGIGKELKFKVKAVLDQVAISNYQLADSKQITIKNMAGLLEVDSNKSSFAIKQGDIKLELADLYSKPLILSDLQGKLTWQPQKLTINKLQVVADKARLQINGEIKIPNNGEIPSADLVITLNNGKLAKVPTYLPNRKIPSVVKWFEKAQFNGDLNNTKAIIRGPINNWLEQFEFNTDFNNTSLQYANGWPQFNRAKGKIVIKNHDLTVTTNDGKSMGLRLDTKNSKPLQVKITSLFKHPSVVEVVVNAQGSIADSLDFVNHSPLQNTININQVLDLTGKLGLQLNLAIPLTRDKQTAINGQLIFKDTTLHDKLFAMTVTDIYGTLHFDKQQVSANNMRGKLRGNPVKFSMFSQTNKYPQRTTLKIHSKADPKFISHYLQHFVPATSQLPLAKFMSGNTPLDITIDFPNSSVAGNKYTDIDIQASLQGMEVKLPQPIGKIADKSKLLAVQLHFDSNKEILIRAAYGTIFNNIFRIQQGKLERGNLVLGSDLATLPDAELLKIQGAIDDLSVTAWLEKFKSKSSNSEASYPLPNITIADLKLNKFEVVGQQLSNVKLNANYTPYLWQAAIKSDKIVGQVKFDKLKNKVDLNFKKIIISIPTSPTSKTDSKSQPPNPHNLPSLSFYCSLLMLDDINLGKIQLTTKPNDDGLKLKLTTRSKNMDLQADGQWRYVVGQHQTRLKATLNSDNIGSMFQQFGYSEPPIVGGASQINLNSYWFAAPYAVNSSNLVGTLNIVTMAGSILKVEPGVGRVFGLFDIYSLPRRLNLDFRDVFDKGFGFDTIAGNFFIKKGIARTEKFILQGPSARVKIDGSTDFVNKKYNQHVTVYPHFSTSLPLAGALALGLVGGAAALIIQQAVQEEFESVINFQYHITGDWDKPKISNTLE